MFSTVHSLVSLDIISIMLFVRIGLQCQANSAILCSLFCVKLLSRSFLIYSFQSSCDYPNQKWYMTVFFFFCYFSSIHQIKSVPSHSVGRAGLLLFILTPFPEGFILYLSVLLVESLLLVPLLSTSGSARLLRRLSVMKTTCAVSVGSPVSQM